MVATNSKRCCRWMPGADLDSNVAHHQHLSEFFRVRYALAPRPLVRFPPLALAPQLPLRRRSTGLARRYGRHDVYRPSPNIAAR
jgi:hypothetical protein